jgi:hypothetical protein
LKGKDIIFYFRRSLTVAILFLFFNQSFAQVNDTIPQEPQHSPKKAALLSAAVPGLGQIYNKKYWKVPIIYGAEIYCYYQFNYFAERYEDYEEAYADMVAGRINQFENRVNQDDVKRVRDIYRRNRDLFVIIMAGVYLVNIMDATVDAFLFDFDVSNDLGMKVQPTTIHTDFSRPVVGVKFSFSF